MDKIVVTTFFEADKCHLQSFENRARILLSMGYITAMPTFSVRQSDKKSELVVITCPKEDRPIWFAFYLGIDVSRNNRPLLTGTD
jgi:hypothetical protein